MRAPSSILPGVDHGQEYLGLTLKQIAQSVKADESTLYRWRSGGTPSPVFLARLEALDDLVSEMRATFKDPALAQTWLYEPIPKLSNRRPVDLILEGRAEVLTGMLYALNSGMTI